MIERRVICGRAAAFRDNDSRDAIIVLFAFCCSDAARIGWSGGALCVGLFLPLVESDDDGRIPRPIWRGTDHADRPFDKRVKIAR
jgi:hypothetical protein